MLIFVAYGIWIGHGQAGWLAATASFLALQGILLIGFALSLYGHDVLETWERGLKAMIYLWGSCSVLPGSQ